MINLLKRIIPVLIIMGFSTAVIGATGDITHVLSHNKTKVITDPTKGYNPYPNWTVFPSKNTEYRKVVLSVTYQCPDSLHCGEWDYIDNIYLRRVGGQNGSSKDIELARMISPYGWRFGSTWKFTWHVDITDFAFLLHDSVEIEFNHTGYENNTDRGWLITLDFACTEGKPAVSVLGMQTLWHGSIPYGDSTKPIDSSLAPVSFTNTFNAKIARLRIHQTGHGMDDFENCAEFCNKWRKVYFDDSLINQRQIWRNCGTNPLFPQAGTWLFNRANWCPGEIVYPDMYDFPINSKPNHTVAIKMEPYINSSKPTANYFMYSYLFFCSAPWAKTDVSLEEIIAPSTTDEYSRMNPICSEPRIRIKNSGLSPLTYIEIKYGITGSKEQTHKWNGLLESQQITDITLPGLIDAKSGGQQFNVTLNSPNGLKDEYPYDNSMSSSVTIPPIYGTQFIIALRTNSDSTHNAFTVKDQNGNIVKERKLGLFTANTTYYDTLNLTPGCYQLIVIDTSGDGLDFWANPEGGYGYVRLLTMTGRLVKSFGSDFGSGINHWFSVAEGSTPEASTDDLPIVNPFPIRNKGIFTLELFQNDPSDITVKITTEDSSRIVFDKNYTGLKEAFLPVDISIEPDGFYFIKVTSGEKTISKKIKVKHKD
jgi:hypothetical protein